MYPSKILNAIKELTKELSENPTFLANYIKEIGLYKKSFMKRKFIVYFQYIR